MTNPFSDQNPYHAPQTPPVMQASVVDNEGDSTHGIIPYKNPMALISYYLGIASLIPCFGAILGIVALVLGILGLRAYKANPKVHGVVHAWIGIVMGGGSALLHGILLLFMIAAAATS